MSRKHLIESSTHIEIKTDSEDVKKTPFKNYSSTVKEIKTDSEKGICSDLQDNSDTQ